MYSKVYTTCNNYDNAKRGCYYLIIFRDDIMPFFYTGISDFIVIFLTFNRMGSISRIENFSRNPGCLLYTSDAADE